MSSLNRMFSSVVSCTCRSSDARSCLSTSILTTRDSMCWLHRQWSSDSDFQLAILRRWTSSAFNAGVTLDVDVASSDVTGVAGVAVVAVVAGVTSVAVVSSECALSVRTHESSTADNTRLCPCWCCIVWARGENGGIPRIYGVSFFLFFSIKIYYKCSQTEFCLACHSFPSIVCCNIFSSSFRTASLSFLFFCNLFNLAL